MSEGPIYSAAMSPLLQPVQMLLLMFAGWVNRHQLDVIEYLQEENRVLKERMGGRRLRFTDAERRRLARKAQVAASVKWLRRLSNVGLFTALTLPLARQTTIKLESLGFLKN